MKKLFLIVISLLTQISFAQNYEEKDIFDTNEKGLLILKPHIKKEINEKIAPIVKQKVDSIKIELEKENYLSKKDIQRELKFVQDTIHLEYYIGEFEQYSQGLTTMGMNWSSGLRLNLYKKLVDDEYNYLISTLSHSGIKKNLIKSQKLWKQFYDNEWEFIYNLNDLGNHNTTLHSIGTWQQMVQERLYFLRRISKGEFVGNWQWNNNWKNYFSE